MLQVISHSSLFIISKVPVSKLKNMNISAVEKKSQLIMFFVPCIVIQLCNVNQQNAQFCWLTLHNQLIKF